MNKFKEMIKKIMEEYSGTGTCDGAMGSGDIISKSVSDPNDSKSVYVPAKGMKKKNKKKKEKEDEN